MKNFNQDDRSDRGRGSKDFGRRDSGRPQMYQAICSDCKRECEVPFRPTGDRPVYCKACFDKHGNTGTNTNTGRGGFDDKRKFEAVCAKCGKRCEVPFRPSGDKPVYCNDCFGKHGNAPAREKSAPSGGNQLDVINAKLDKILAALNQGGLVSAAPKKAIEEKKAKAAPVKKAAKSVKKAGKKKK